jgi:hypothetical protein
MDYGLDVHLPIIYIYILTNNLTNIKKENETNPIDPKIKTNKIHNNPSPYSIIKKEKT